MSPSSVTILHMLDFSLDANLNNSYWSLIYLFLQIATANRNSNYVLEREVSILSVEAEYLSTGRLGSGGHTERPGLSSSVKQVWWRAVGRWSHSQQANGGLHLRRMEEVFHREVIT